MSSAKLYISTPVVERLTAPSTRLSSSSVNNLSNSSMVGDTEAVDIDSFMGSFQQQMKQKKGGVKKGSFLEDYSNSARFKEFLGRQAQTQLKAQREVEEVARCLTPGFRPKLCRKSLELSARGSQGSFLDRVDHDTRRRSETEKGLARMYEDREASFTPSILVKSHKLRSRSVHELSLGDAVKMEQSQRLLKHRTEKLLLEGVTFQPELTLFARRNGKSAFVKAEEQSTSFLEAHAMALARAEEQREAMRRLREKEELSACSFVPETKACPAYIGRIAKSMALLRAVRQQELEKTLLDVAHEKPQWK